MSKSNKPLTPINPISISPITMFFAFIAFSIVSSLWTNIGMLYLQKYFPSPSKEHLFNAAMGATVITAIFAVFVSYLNIKFTNYVQN